MRRQTCFMAILAAALLVIGCAGLKLQAPSVTVADLQVVEASLLAQRFVFKLRVQNPNDREIPVKGMSFEVTINDEPFARGVSNKTATLPRLSETIMEVAAVSDLSAILRQIGALRRDGKNSVSYRIRGRLFTGLLVDLNFENSGVLDFPVPPGEK
ncbi:MAG: LEA type 2 family protein [Syntrophales bacterium]|nr:LEA type 2 family protein [Syntrophales bacterium]